MAGVTSSADTLNVKKCEDLFGDKGHAKESDLDTSDQSRRPTFGARLLDSSKNVFEHNAWDNVEWDEEQENDAKKITTEHLNSLVPEDQQVDLEEKASEYWDKFYGQHNNRFFKDRQWLFTEFPELIPGGVASATDKRNSLSLQNEGIFGDNDNEEKQKGIDDSLEQLENDKASCTNQKDEDQNEEVTCGTGETSSCTAKEMPFRIFEVGCGVGNTVFPVLQTINDPNLKVYCCDFSDTAIQIVKDHPDYTKDRCHAFVCDITDESKPLPFPENSLDVIVLIFVLCGIHPDKMQSVVNLLARHLKPGGVMILRDYGRYDLAQLRFKKGKCLTDNFYMRGDGTRVYFFTQEELRDMFTKAGLQEKQNIVDRRLQVNRGRQLKMYRVWIQCKYIKPLKTESKTDDALCAGVNIQDSNDTLQQTPDGTSEAVS